MTEPPGTHKSVGTRTQSRAQQKASWPMRGFRLSITERARSGCHSGGPAPGSTDEEPDRILNITCAAGGPASSPHAQASVFFALLLPIRRHSSLSPGSLQHPLLQIAVSGALCQFSLRIQKFFQVIKCPLKGAETKASGSYALLETKSASAGHTVF